MGRGEECRGWTGGLKACWERDTCGVINGFVMRCAVCGVDGY